MYRFRSSRQPLWPLLLMLFLIWATHDTARAQLLDPGTRHYTSWNGQTDAVQKLWDARYTYSRTWQWGTPSADLHADIRDHIAKGRGRTGRQDTVYLIVRVEDY